MNRPRTAQEFLPWLEAGDGARGIRLAAGFALTVALLLALLVARKQFHGPGTEATLLQADLERQIARGEGFTPLVNFPQTAAFLQERGGRFDPAQPFPELHQAPRHPLVIAGALRALPAGPREKLFASPPAQPDGLAADYFLSGLNVGLLCLAAWLTFALGSRWFEPRGGWLAAFALLLSVPVGQPPVAVNGGPLRLGYGDTSFRNVADVASRLKRPVLGVIPFQRNPLGSADADPANTEPFRVLHTNLNLALQRGQSQAVELFSAGPGEGQSTTLHRLAALMGAGGERVVLIDSDLRRPTQPRLANRPTGPGLSDFLLGQHTLDEVTQRTVSPGLDFIPSGTHAGFTLGLLHANRRRDLIAPPRGRYEKIVFDSPPIIGGSDASVLASAVDGAVLLIQHRRNPQSLVLRAQPIGESLKTPRLGVVLNQVPLHSGEDYGYYTNNYAYYSDGSGEKTRRSHAPSAPRPPAGKLVLSERGPDEKG